MKIFRMLLNENFEKAVKFIQNNARELDISIFEVEFEDADPHTVIQSLKKYQNTDGGFGNGIEPDIQLKSSSVLATTVGLQYLNEIDVGDSEITSAAIAYLNDQLSWINFSENDNQLPYWNSVPLEVNQEPHAPWWSREILSPPEIESWANPNIEIIGRFNQYSKYVEPTLLSRLNQFVEEYLGKVPKLEGLSDPSGFAYYDFYCWKRSLPHLPEPLLDKAFVMLDRSFNEEILKNTNYSAVHPQWLVTEKTSYLYEKYPKILQKQLAVEISRQEADGGWHPSWQWGDPELWNKIEREWAGKMTVETLTTLKYCELLE